MNENSVVITYKSQYKERPFLVLEGISGDVVEFVRADFRAREIECIIEEDSFRDISECPEVESIVHSVDLEF
jgi:hypothetical protein